MMDDLDLVFEEDPDRGRHRHRRATTTRKRKKKRRGRGRTFLAFFLVLLLLGGLGFGVWRGFDWIEQRFSSAPDYNSGGTTEVTIEVKPDETATDIANTLFRAGVVKSAAAFIAAANLDPRSRNIAPGVYKVRRQMRAADVLTLLLDPNSKVVTKITIPEGRTALSIYRLLSEKTGIKPEEFVAAAKDPVALGVPEFWFKRNDGKPITQRSIEGFLFPATYDFNPGLSAKEILRTMVGQFIQVATEIKFVERVQAERGGISPYEALITASLAQAEAGVPEDIGKIARVAYNRVYKKEMPLQFDVTVNYWLELTGKPGKSSAQMTESDLHNPNNPYNTHDFRGLTPTPINNPGRVALEGAMAPPAGEWLYFVAIDQQGHSAFATTLAEHDRNRQRACQNGVLRC